MSKNAISAKEVRDLKAAAEPKVRCPSPYNTPQQRYTAN